MNLWWSIQNNLTVFLVLIYVEIGLVNLCDYDLILILKCNKNVLSIHTFHTVKNATTASFNQLEKLKAAKEA